MAQNSSPIRVLILTTAYLPEIGGSELAIKNISGRLLDINFDLITSRPDKSLAKEEKIENVNVYRVGGFVSLFSFLLPKNFLPIPIFFKAIRLIKQYGSYDLIHVYQASQAAGGAYMLKWFYPKIPFLLTIQEGKDLNRQLWLLRFFRYLIFKKVDAATAISNHLASFIRSQNSKIPIYIIPNGVDLKQFPISSFQFPKKDKQGKTIITVSRLVEKNGVEDLIDAFHILKTKYQISDTRLLIIGDGPLRKNLELRVKNLGLEGGVKILGTILNDDLPRYLAEADVFVRASLSEGLGIAFLEAMASGVPIIGTRVGGIPDFLTDEQTGLFCNVSDPENLAEKIKLMFDDKDLRERLIKNAADLIAEKYDWNKIAPKFREIYAKI